MKTQIDCSIQIERQHKFHKERQWAFDFAFQKVRVAVEIQGYGTGHTSYEGMSRDYQKHNEALRYGWAIVYLMSNDLTRTKIRKTTNYVRTIIEERLRNKELCRMLRELKPSIRHSQLPPELRMDE